MLSGNNGHNNATISEYPHPFIFKLPLLSYQKHGILYKIRVLKYLNIQIFIKIYSFFKYNV
jgi:hypothetical protein